MNTNTPRTPPMPTNEPEVVLPEPKFGEWLRGVHASERNPHRDGMYVRTIIREGRFNPGEYYELTDGEGDFWTYLAESTERIAPPADTLTRPADGEYDRELIACMLQDFRRGRLGTYKTESVEEQIALLREADNRDAAGVRTVNLSAAPKHIVQKVDEAERGLQTPRRVKAVELLLSLGYQWDGAQWSQPQKHGQEVGGDFHECPHCKGWSRTSTQQPAEAVAVDLERFREPVLFWQNHCYSALGLESALRVRSEALDLLAIIDTPPPAIDIGKLRELVARWRATANALSPNDARSYSHAVGIHGCVDELAALIGDGGERA